jgi:hypothetical protein
MGKLHDINGTEKESETHRNKNVSAAEHQGDKQNF